MRRFCLLLVLLLSAASCTAPRWVISDGEAVDTGTYDVIATEYLLLPAATVTPEDPTLRWQLHTVTTREYPVRVRAERHLQEYRLRPGYVLLGAAGAGVALWLANSGEMNSLQRAGLGAAGGLVALYGLLNMKPSGPPQPTGEERFLRQTGSVQRTDTAAVSAGEGDAAEVVLLFNGEPVFSDAIPLSSSGMLEIGLGAPLSSLDIRGPDPGEVRAEVAYADSLYRIQWPVDQILQPYAEVTTPVAELRSEPDRESDNILAELAEGSRLNVTGPGESGDWYRVRYGVTRNYILKSSAELNWDTAESEDANRVVTVTRIPFGQVDVETNIPILSPLSPENRALVVTNERYGEPFGTRTYTHRDGRLIASYLVKSLGYPEGGVDTLRDVQSAETVLGRIDRLGEQSTDSSGVFIYLGGYTRVESDTSGIGLHFLLSPDSSGAGAISLDRLFDRIAEVPGDKIVVADLDFRTAGDAPDERTIDLRQPLRRLSDRLVRPGSRTAVFFPSGIDQQSQLYIGPSVDKKHHIFPYYFVRALQERHTMVSDIQQYLNSNVTYTARRYHDRAQEPQVFGEINLNLTGDR